MLDQDAVKIALEAGIQHPVVVELSPESKVAIIPHDMQLVDITKYLPPPKRVKQAVTLLTVKSFLDYVERYAYDRTAIFANEVEASYEAIIDYHFSDALDGEDEARGECDHVARYKCPLSEQWQAWKKKDGQWFTQTDFAEFLETRLRDITDPAGAQFLELALDLQVHKSADFASEVNRENGQVRFRYEETVRGNKKAGDLAIPARFKIQVPVFVDGTVYEIEARFRYTMDGGKLTLGYQLLRPTEVWQAAVKGVTALIQAGATDIALYAGTRG